MIIAGNGIYERCSDCGKLVKINKWCGGLHFCPTSKEIANKRRNQQIQQENYRNVLTGFGGFGQPIFQQKPNNNN